MCIEPIRDLRYLEKRSLKEDLSAFFPMQVDPHLFDWIIAMHCSRERITGAESWELLERLRLRLMILLQKVLHSEEPRAADMFDWAAQDPALRLELPLTSPIWILMAMRSPASTARLRARVFFRRMCGICPAG